MWIIAVGLNKTAAPFVCSLSRSFFGFALFACTRIHLNEIYFNHLIYLSDSFYSVCVLFLCLSYVSVFLYIWSHHPHLMVFVYLTNIYNLDVYLNTSSFYEKLEENTTVRNVCSMPTLLMMPFFSHTFVWTRCTGTHPSLLDILHNGGALHEKWSEFTYRLKKKCNKSSINIILIICFIIRVHWCCQFKAGIFTHASFFDEALNCQSNQLKNVFSILLTVFLCWELRW